MPESARRPLDALVTTIAELGSEEPDPAVRLRQTLRSICEFTGWPVGQAYQVDSVGTAHRWLTWHAAQSRWSGFVSASNDAVLSAGVGLPGRVVGSRRPTWVADVGDDRNFPRAEAARMVGLHGGFAFPVVVDDQVVVVLEFFSEGSVEPSAELLEAFAQVGRILAHSLDARSDGPALAADVERLRQILDTAGDAFISMDALGRVTEWNREAEHIFGWRRDEVVNRGVSELIIPEGYREAHDQGLERFLATGEARVLGQRLELTALRRDGGEFPIELTLWALREQATWTFYAFARDITARKQAEAELAHDAMHDALTGLANRTVLMNQLAHSLSRMDRGDSGPAVLFVDLDRFKPINDTFGHDAGDQVLVVVAERLQTLIRGTDLVARLSGDEFVVLLDQTPTARDAALIAARITDAISEPIPLSDRWATITASVGVAVARPDSTPEALINNADAAMYQAKHAGRGRYDIYGEQLRERVTSRLRRETELTRALDEGEFELFYQPVYSLPDLTITGVEALIRWHHPAYGLLLPGDFIDIAEESGQVVPIGAWVLDEACRQVRAWREDSACNDAGLQIAVNLSARQLAHPGLAKQVADIVTSNQLPISRLQLCLEITESVLMHDPDSAARTLNELRELGITLAIDDFGTGYSSLAYLKWFPVDTVKVDRTFVNTIVGNATDRAIVQALVTLTGELGLTMVAEGVETKEQLDLLVELGCTRAQGFLLGRPQPPQALTSQLLRPSGPLALT